MVTAARASFAAGDRTDLLKASGIALARSMGAAVIDLGVSMRAASILPTALALSARDPRIAHVHPQITLVKFPA